MNVMRPGRLARHTHKSQKVLQRQPCAYSRCAHMTNFMRPTTAVGCGGVNGFAEASLGTYSTLRVFKTRSHEEFHAASQAGVTRSLVSEALHSHDWVHIAPRAYTKMCSHDEFDAASEAGMAHSQVSRGVAEASLGAYSTSRVNEDALA